jgi:hypothetical protein
VVSEIELACGGLIFQPVLVCFWFQGGRTPLSSDGSRAAGCDAASRYRPRSSSDEWGFFVPSTKKPFQVEHNLERASAMAEPLQLDTTLRRHTVRHEAIRSANAFLTVPLLSI